jgi:hypothetical protein
LLTTPYIEPASFLANPSRPGSSKNVNETPGAFNSIARHGKTNQEFWRQLPLLAVSPEV